MGTKFLPGASTRTSKETLRFPNAVSILLDKERSSVDTPFFAPAQEGMKDPPGKGTQPGTEHRHDPADKFMEFSTLNLSAIRDRQELLQVLTQGLKDHFGFDDA